MTLQQVHVRVNDAATGKPTPCRVRFTDAEGKYYAPFGRQTEFATEYGVDVGGNVIADGKKYAYIDGTCEIALPPGKIIIEVHKGPEYTPLHVEHQLLAGKLSLRLTLERWINLREHGWYSGDSRCHFLTPHAALLEGMAEDLAVVNLLAMECQIPETDQAGERVTGHQWAIPNLLAFSGQQPALEAPGHMVVVNTLNWHPWLGRLGLLNCHRVVYPLHFGAPGNDDWTLADWCDQCHRKGGLVVWTEGAKCWGEALADALLGKIDAIEIKDSSDQTNFHNAALLTAIGIPLALVGGSGKVSNLETLGEVRTYARLAPGEPFSYKAWIHAVRCRRTFITNGPLLRLTVDGRDPGNVIELPAKGGPVNVCVEAQSSSPIDHVELFYPGGHVTKRCNGIPSTANIERAIQVNRSGWIAASCSNRKRANGPLAATSAILVRVNDQAPPQHPGIVQLESELLTAQGRAEKENRFTNDAHRQRLLGIFEQALAKLRSLEPLAFPRFLP